MAARPGGAFMIRGPLDGYVVPVHHPAASKRPVKVDARGWVASISSARARATGRGWPCNGYLPWWWADESDNNTVDIAGLPPGQHKVKAAAVEGCFCLSKGDVDEGRQSCRGPTEPRAL